MGFGVCDGHGAGLYFDAFTRSDPDFDAILAGPSGPPLAGSGSGAYSWNSRSMRSRIFDAQTRWCVGFNLEPLYAEGFSSSLWAQDNFIQIGDAIGPILSLELQIDGTLAVMSGGNGETGTGTEVGRTIQTFPVSSWTQYLEFETVGYGASTTFQLFSNDVSILLGSTTTPRVPDRVSIGSLNGQVSGLNAQPFFGLVFANVYIQDGQSGVGGNTRYGPVRITTMYPASDASGAWSASPSGPLFSNISDLPGVDRNGSPDGDFSTISPVIVNNPQYFTMSSSPCYGQIVAVAVNQCFRGLTGSTTCDALILQQATSHTIGSSVVTGGYHTAQQFIDTSFITGMPFVDSEINGALWGAKTASTGLLLTQMFLEKIVSLRAVPFQCGQGSYSF